MNQILFLSKSNRENLKYYKIYLYLFFISISFCVVILFYIFFSRIYEKEKTQLLKAKYNISTLYSLNNNYTSLKMSNNIFIIGSIDIPKINISYPIIENTNEKSLKISVCRFSGPLPNRIGNLCIAGHNYKNSSMFSKLHKLNIGDSFFITDLNNTKLKYIIYEKFIVTQNNLACTKDTNNVEVTLITCYNHDNSKRLVIKAKMEG